MRSLGINPADGKELFLDAEGNVTETWDPAYRVYCGVGEPTYRGSLNSLISYKNLSFNLSFGFHWGGKQYNSTLLDKVEVPVGLEGSGVEQSIINNELYEVMPIHLKAKCKVLEYFFNMNK